MLLYFSKTIIVFCLAEKIKVICSFTFQGLQCLLSGLSRLSLHSKDDNAFIYFSKDFNVFNHLCFQKTTMSSFTFQKITMSSFTFQRLQRLLSFIRLNVLGRTRRSLFLCFEKKKRTSNIFHSAELQCPHVFSVSLPWFASCPVES